MSKNCRASTMNNPTRKCSCKILIKKIDRLHATRQPTNTVIFTKCLSLTMTIVIIVQLISNQTGNPKHSFVPQNTNMNNYHLISSTHS